MQTVIPLWVTVALAFLAPVAALVGVVVGAVMNRRTTRLQLQAAEKRDQELWTREDRHRFLEQRRSVYVDFLGQAGEYRYAVEKVFEFAHNLQEKHVGHTAVFKVLQAEGQKLGLSLDQFGCTDNLRILLGQIELMAPREVVGFAQVSWVSMTATLGVCVDQGVTRDSGERFEYAYRNMIDTAENLREVMRKDLALES